MDLDLDLDALQLLAGESAQLIIELDKGCTNSCLLTCGYSCDITCDITSNPF
ncbi:hypothetical protein Aph02nite_14890 [Actinoplanes philippinensis]|uniref:Uncharacterized protein n=1 Tax=Actinoplanes philippinensis TaxID=35752 RepID=A0A1I1ZE32_9ACTN|nr:hypothetical protein [Actinoplanes philippinensis]GIE75539.1 hypothetical protein Aph02nite_14890 [Actinoplanes philippinensis]SFE29852.1 hypothetical protein SAMN05421541_10148 [Actinoplanes philippinensis]